MPRQRFIIEKTDQAWIGKLGWLSVDDVLACASQDVAALSQTSDVVRVSIDAALGGPSAVFVKRYLYQRLGQRIKQMFRGTLLGPSRARTEYEFLHEMCRRGVPTVRPIAYGERRRGMFLWASFVITEGSQGFESFDLFALSKLGRHKAGPPDRRKLIDKLGHTIRQLHDAGVRHGGLYWRNILTATSAQGEYEFLLLDPDTHARLFHSSVPPSDALADLSEFIASAMALDVRCGLRALMQAYFHTKTLDSAQQQFVAGVVDKARALAPAERRRMAVTEIIEWLRQRIASQSRRVSTGPTVDSLDAFFERLTASQANAQRRSMGSRRIRFSFADSGGSESTSRIEREVTLADGRFSLDTPIHTDPDLVIRSDQETWLAVIAGHPDAFQRVRAGKLRVYGDTTLLPTLVGPIDEEPVAL